MGVKISITSGGHGWTLTSSLSADPVYYLSGGRAERSARSLAERLAKAGEDVELEIRLADGSLVDRIAFRAAHPAV
ncbi:MAG: hypothetical protein JWM33_1499 [Caulobacteraceae bacterium]|nr:hypothetical protein [Caulobacteraceae bacterium]